MRWTCSVCGWWTNGKAAYSSHDGGIERAEEHLEQLVRQHERDVHGSPLSVEEAFELHVAESLAIANETFAVASESWRE